MLIFEHSRRLETDLFSVWFADFVVTGMVLWEGYYEDLIPKPAFPGQELPRYDRMAWYTLQFAKLIVTANLVIAAYLRNPRYVEFCEGFYHFLCLYFHTIALTFDTIASFLWLIGQQSDIMKNWALTFSMEAVLPVCGVFLFVHDSVGRRPHIEARRRRRRR